MHQMTVNDKEYTIIKMLGKGKGGYSYLAEKDGRQYVLKQIHHEPCSYYSFGNKIESEKCDYQRLLNAGIRIPKMLEIDMENERILKEYIEGDTIFDMVKNDFSVEPYLEQVKEMADKAKFAGLKYWSKTPEFIEYVNKNAWLAYCELSNIDAKWS